MSTKENNKSIINLWWLIGFLTLFLTGCITTAAADPNTPDIDQGGELNQTPSSAEPENPLKLEVGIEPTPLPPTSIYSSQYGFEFSYPETWILKEIDQGVEVEKDSARLVIQAWWSDEINPAVRWYGTPAGDLLYRDKQTFLEQVLPVSYLEYEGKTKQVLYNEGKVISSGDLQILIYLESLGADYESVDLSEGVIADAKMILETIQRTDMEIHTVIPKSDMCATDQENPHSDWIVYQNEEYGFYFYHPQDMEIDEANHILNLQQGDLRMRIEYRKFDEAYPLTGKLPEGEVELTEFVTYFGDENPNPIVVERSGGQITRVSVGNQISRDTPVQFLVSISSASSSVIDLAQANAMLEILDYLCITL